MARTRISSTAYLILRIVILVAIVAIAIWLRIQWDKWYINWNMED